MLYLSFKSNYGNNINLDFIWQAILGVTDTFLRVKVTEELYTSYCMQLKEELYNHMLNNFNSKYLINDGDKEVMIPGSKSGHINEELEYRFYMYRHWSLFESMLHSDYMAAKMSVWQSIGANKLKVSQI